jgi:hypothetical protein
MVAPPAHYRPGVAGAVAPAPCPLGLVSSVTATCSSSTATWFRFFKSMRTMKLFRFTKTHRLL